MTTRLIAVAITPDPDGVRCGECVYLSGADHDYYCGVYGDPLGTTRLKKCLAAEKALTDVVEAGRTMSDYLGRGNEPAFDAALANLERLREGK